jgi:3-carboxy-cis,cis-muconate cycloisomerase
LTFEAIFVPVELRRAVSDQAWLEAMLEVEQALANAEAFAGVIPAHAAGAIAAACRAESFDIAALAEAGRSTGNPAEPLVRALREAVGGTAADAVHFGATSQDVLDSAAMLVARRALDLILPELDGVAAACARLAATFRLTPMAARTLLQQAVPTSFGLKAAGWLVAVVSARRGLAALRAGGLAAQLGGAAGTLAALGADGVAVARQFAVELDLPEAVVPWHSDRTRVAELGARLALAAGAVAKIGLDVALLEQTEVGEVAEPPGSGGSSTMPQKRNPVASAIAVACARRARAAAGVLAESLVQEHERSLGGWQAEWDALSAALESSGGAAAAIRGLLETLEVDGAQMRANLELSGGAIMSERLSFALAARVGRAEAQRLLAAAAARSVGSGRALRAELAAEPPAGLSAGELDELFDPTTYLGAAQTLVDRALAFYREETQ